MASGHDFSAGKHGNIFDFVMETEGLSFPEAVERLAAEARAALPVADAGNRERARKSAPRCTKCSNSPRTISSSNLQSREGAKARGYLADRGIAPALQRQFRLGYGRAEKFALRDHLAGKGATRRNDDRGGAPRARRGYRGPL